MFQNIKVDIVYYKTGTDFEMEFNLCGCCRMRLLTDKTSDKQTFVHSLARAVSRSKVIMVVGALFGENGTITTVANAIGSGISAIDSKAYGIASNEKTEIIDGATPLVTADGCFGGCIMENGPQTMILLSESKSIRKPIMQTLIHPYMEQLFADELKGKSSQTQNAEADTENTEPTDAPFEDSDTSENIESESLIGEATGITPTDETEEQNVEASVKIKSDNASSTQEEPSEEVSGGMSFEENGNVISANDEEIEEDEELFAEPMKMGHRKSKILNRAYVDFEEDGFFTEEEAPKKSRLAHKSELPILIISVLLLVLIAFLCYCIFYVPSLSGTSPTDYLRDIFDTLFKSA